ncbi:MAG: WG repeat-containing protein [Oscillospiraceae bacterium]|nr:WG repeat-containing protein [Oscillospiraceae bacterium]
MANIINAYLTVIINYYIIIMAFEKGIKSMSVHYYPVDVEHHGKKPGPEKRKKMSQSQIKLIAIISFAVIALISGMFYITDKILNPELIKILVEPTLDYDGIIPCGEERLRAHKGEKVGLIDKRGKTVAPLIYDFIIDFSDGLAIAYKDGKVGLIEKNGNVVIDFIYNDISCFYDGLAKVCIDGKYGYINQNGEIVIPLIYDYVFDFSNGFARFWKDDTHGVIDTAGNIVFPFEYDSHIEDIGDGFFVKWRDDGKCGLINKSGEIVLPEEYEMIRRFQEGLAVVQKDGKFGYIDMTGDIIIPIEYKSARDFNDGMAIVELFDGRNITGYSRAWSTWAYINKSGEIAFTVKYNFFYEFSDDGLAMVSNYDNSGAYGVYRKYGFIDKSGEIVIPMIYEGATPFEYGLAAVYGGNKSGVIDTTGDFVVELIYDSVRSIIGEGKIIIAEKNTKYGLLNNKGEVILAFEYDNIISGGNRGQDNLLSVRKDGKWGIIEIKK